MLRHCTTILKKWYNKQGIYEASWFYETCDRSYLLRYIFLHKADLLSLFLFSKSLGFGWLVALMRKS